MFIQSKVLPMREKSIIWDKDSIRALRVKYGLTQELFAHIIGIRQQTVSEWELGQYKPENAYRYLLDNLEDHLAFIWMKSQQDKKEFAYNIFLKYGGVNPLHKKKRKSKYLTDGESNAVSKE